MGSSWRLSAATSRACLKYRHCVVILLTRGTVKRTTGVLNQQGCHWCYTCWHNFNEHIELLNGYIAFISLSSLQRWAQLILKGSASLQLAIIASSHACSSCQRGSVGLGGAQYASKHRIDATTTCGCMCFTTFWTNTGTDKIGIYFRANLNDQSCWCFLFCASHTLWSFDSWVPWTLGFWATQVRRNNWLRLRKLPSTF